MTTVSSAADRASRMKGQPRSKRVVKGRALRTSEEFIGIRAVLSAFASSHALEDAGRALAGADAHRHHAVLEVVTAQGVHDGRRADRAGGAERMAERDGAAHRIDLRWI